MLLPHCLWALVGLLFLSWFPRKPKVPTYPVGSLELWQEHYSLRNASRKLSRRDLLLLFLQWLCYLCLVFAWAHPVWQGESCRKVTIVLDRTASMQSGSFENSVFNRAIEQTTVMLKQLSAHDRVELHTFPPHKIYRESPRRLCGVIADLHPSQQQAHFAPFLADITRNSKSPVYFVSDGNEKITSANVIQINYGLEKTDNIGIVDFSVKPTKEGQRIFAAIENFSTRSVTTFLTILADSSPVSRQKLLLLPEQRLCWDKVVDISSVSTLTLKLKHTDNFALDDEVYAVRSPAIAIWLPLKAPPDIYLLFESIPGIYRIKNRKNARLKFIVRKSAWLLCTNSFSLESLRWSTPKKLPCTWTADPLLEAVCPELIDLPEVATLELKPTTGKILLETPMGPAMAYGEGWLFIGFPLQKSNWPSLPSFPIFWQNYFDYLAPERDSFCYVRTQTFHPHTGIFRKPEKPELAVNLLSEEESNNKGRVTRISHWPPKPSIGVVAHDLRPYLVIVTVLLLLLLWWYGS